MLKPWHVGNSGVARNGGCSFGTLLQATRKIERVSTCEHVTSFRVASFLFVWTKNCLHCHLDSFGSFFYYGGTPKNHQFPSSWACPMPSIHNVGLVRTAQACARVMIVQRRARPSAQKIAPSQCLSVWLSVYFRMCSDLDLLRSYKIIKL